MKRIFTVVLILTLLISSVGCQNYKDISVGGTLPSDGVETTTKTPGETNPSEPTNPTNPTNPTDPTETTDPEQGVEDPTVIPVVDELNNPTFPTTWVAICNERMSIWDVPGGNTIDVVYRGNTMELHFWVGKYAFVTFNGLKGYVLGSYIKPADDTYFADCFDIVEPTNVYSYEQLCMDLAKMEEKYPDRVVVDSIGKSALGSDIPVMRIGSLDAEYHILIQGAMHAREHMTSWLVMAMMDYWLDRDFEGNSDVCYHIIPMINPDGVTISQTGVLTPEQEAIYTSDRYYGYTNDDKETYATLWKSNGQGIDINRDFPPGWDRVIDSRPRPSSERSQGNAPFSSPEAAALRDYTLSYEFDTTISYHSNGCLIYWEFGRKQPVNNQSYALGMAVNAVSGYEMIGDSGTSAAGYKDWVMDELGIPSLTIEIGAESSPMPEREIYSIFARNYRVIPAIVNWLQS